ncbi:hypothetical protein RB600_006739 [Gaeumannomyces tritici]
MRLTHLASPAALLLLAAGPPQAVLVVAKPSPIVPRDDVVSIGAMGNMTWEGELEPGKGNVTLTGPTFENIEQQSRQLNETYSIFNFNRPHAEMAKFAEAEAAPAGVRSHDCMRYKLPIARIPWILDSAETLRRAGGTCTLTGKLCTRAACQWGSGIFWCNDNVGTLAVPCATIGERAIYLEERCTNNVHFMQGSVTDDWNWRTIVHGDNC